MANTYLQQPLDSYGLPDKRVPLKILIAGAGIGGLTAAFVLREAGHTVEVFEASKQAQETGAALHVSPNASGLIQRLGIDMESIGAVKCAGMRDYAPEDGKIRFSIDMAQSGARFHYPLYFVHRQRIHAALKQKALGTEGKGKPVELHLQSPVASADPENASFTLADGRIVKGDLIIGADGVKSQTRAAIKGLKAFGSGKSAFRFLIPYKTLAANPKAAVILEPQGFQCHWVKNNRRLIAYPCDGNETMNYVAIHPSVESTANTEAGDAWQQSCSKEQMLKIFSGFNENVQSTLEQVLQDDLKIWPLWDMEKMPSFAKENLALIGDAAHPLMPYQGQGAGLAMEDAISLAALLPLGTLKGEIPERLRIYNSCRWERDHEIQNITRNVGKDAAQIEAEGIKLDYPKFQTYMYSHDEWHHSSYALRKHLEEQQQLIRRTPISFGAQPSPFQPLNLNSGSQSLQTLQKIEPETYSTYSVRFRTARTYLKHLLPQGFSFFASGTTVSATLSCTARNNVAWLGGASSTQISLSLHDIFYTKKDGSTVHGAFIPIQFSNVAEQVIASREESGLPQVYADITTISHSDSFISALSWRGVQFGTFALSGLSPKEPVKAQESGYGSAPTTNGTATAKVNGDAAPTKSWGPPPPPPEQGCLVHRYVPSADGSVKPDAEYALLYPFSHKETLQAAPIENGSTTTQVAKDATIAFEAKTWASLPTLHHIAKGLAEMPVFGIEKTSVESGFGAEEKGKPVRLD